jgi:non-specific serine/threonine protein kinase
LLGLAAHIAGDYVAADAFYDRSMAIRQAIGHREAIGVLHQLMGISAYRQGSFLRARELYVAYLAISRELDSPWHLSMVLAQFASLAAVQQQPQRAARLFGAAALVNEMFRTRPIPLVEELFREGVELARKALGEAAFAVAMAEGQAMAPEEAVAEALAVEVARPGRSIKLRLGTARFRRNARQRAEDEPVGPLTRREQEVTILVARGLTNRQIAAELVVTERTVAAHLEHILDKLGFASRTQVAAWAGAQQAGAASASRASTK